MNRSLLVAFLLLACLGTSASQAGFKPQPFVANPNVPIKTIGVLQVPESRYLLGEGTSKAAAGFFNPALFAIIDHAAKEEHPEYEAAGFSFAPVAQRQLINHLKAAGYKVVVVPVARDKPNQLLKSYNALPTTGVDAYLDIAPTGVGFQGSYAPFAKKVGPHVSTFVRLVSARTHEVLYQDYIHYGWGIAPAITGTELEAPEAHVFKKTKVLKNDLTSADKQQSIGQLTHGIDVVMQTIVAAFSAYSVRGLPQQAGATPRTDAPIEVSRAARAAMPSPGVAIPKGTASTAYKIAIFPFESDSSCVGRSRPSNEKLAAELWTFVKSNDSLALAYSYYDPNLNDPPIETPGRLWKGSKPNVAQVYALGQSQGLDAVVMYWRPVAVGVSQVGCSSYDVWYPIEVYLFDVKQKKIYRLKGHERNLSAMTKQALSKFLAGATPKVVATAPIQRGEVRSTHTASAASPFEGITLPPGGSIEAINAAAEAYCGSLNKKSKLIAAPPNNADYVFQCYQPTKAVSAPIPPPRKTLAKTAPGIQQGTASYNIGIFPGVGDFDFGRGGGTPWAEKYTAEFFANYTRVNVSSLKLAYSYYDPGLNQPRIYDYTKVWAGNKPKLSAIYREAGTRDLDAVFLYRCDGISSIVNWAGPMPIELYLIDVKQKRTYAQKGDTDRLEKMVQGLISRFLQGQPR